MDEYFFEDLHGFWLFDFHRDLQEGFVLLPEHGQEPVGRSFQQEFPEIEIIFGSLHFLLLFLLRTSTVSYLPVGRATGCVSGRMYLH